MRPTETIKAELLAAMTARDPTALEDAVLAAFEAELPPELAELLAEALVLPWHFRHEEIAVALDRMRDPRAVPALATAALLRPPYLAYDDGWNLAKVCTRALADIANAEARRRLEELANCGQPACAAWARKRLDAWDRADVGKSAPRI